MCVCVCGRWDVSEKGPEVLCCVHATGPRCQYSVCAPVLTYPIGLCGRGADDERPTSTAETSRARQKNLTSTVSSKASRSSRCSARVWNAQALWLPISALRCRRRRVSEHVFGGPEAKVVERTHGIQRRAGDLKIASRAAVCTRGSKRKRSLVQVGLG